MRLAVVAIALLCACHRDHPQEAPCEVVGNQLMTVARDSLGKATVTADARRVVNEQLPPMRDALVVACTKGEWPAAVRNCMANAIDHAALETCERQLTAAQRHYLDQP